MPQIQMNKSKNLSVEDAYELFIRKCRVKNLSNASITSYQNKIHPFVDYCMECNYMTIFKIHLPKAQKEIKETYSNEQLEKLLVKPDMVYMLQRKCCRYVKITTGITSFDIKRAVLPQ